MKGFVWVSGFAAGLMVFGLQGWAAIAQTAPILQEQGALEEGDQVLSSDGSLYDVYTFEGKAGQAIDISLESTDFDTYLALVDPEQQVIAENDDVNENDRNSKITVTLPSDGTYTIVANGFDRTSRGQYSLSVMDSEESPAPSPDAP
ncbi:MAG TPA: PPC domain-containing protein [Crinalium sp.]|jgi:serine protease Do